MKNDPRSCANFKCHVRYKGEFILRMVTRWDSVQLIFWQAMTSALDVFPGRSQAMNYHTYNPGQRVWDTSPFSSVFVWNLQLNKIFAPPPLPPRTKLRALTFARYVKGVWLVTPNTFRRGGGSTRITFSSPETQSVPNVWTRIVRPTKLSSYLKESVIFAWKRGSPRHSSRSEVYNLFACLHQTRIPRPARYSLGYKLLEFRWCPE